MAIERLGPALGICLLAGLVLAGCGGAKEKEGGVPDLTDEPVLQAPQWRSVAVKVSAYGLAVVEDGRLYFEVSVGKGAAADIAVGQDATVQVRETAVDCRVEKILRQASAETGEALVWLRPFSAPAGIQGGDFALAHIATRQLGRACTVPAKAVYVRDGRSVVVLRRGSGTEATYEAVTVTTGATDGEWVQIPSGLKASDQVVCQGGLGFLYPDFKSQGGD